MRPLLIECLKKVIEFPLLLKHIVACRFGGEEFVCVSASHSESEVHALADKVKQGVIDKKIEHAKSDVSPYLTVSVGSTIGQADAMNAGGIVNIESLLALADEALYKAKSQGRNRHVHV